MVTRFTLRFIKGVVYNIVKNLSRWTDLSVWITWWAFALIARAKLQKSPRTYPLPDL